MGTETINVFYAKLILDEDSAARLADLARRVNPFSNYPRTVEDFHTTTAYSPVIVQAVDHDVDIAVSASDMSWEDFGNGVLVLALRSPEIVRLNEIMKDQGAVWNFPDYKPHITIATDFADVIGGLAKPDFDIRFIRHVSRIKTTSNFRAGGARF